MPDGLRPKRADRKGCCKCNEGQRLIQPHLGWLQNARRARSQYQ